MTDLQSISEKLFDFLKTRFSLASTVTEDGKTTSKPEDMRVFSFTFETPTHDDLGTIVISLLEEGEIRVYFGRDIVDSDSTSVRNWQNFLRDIKKFAVTNMLEFSAKNINRPRITKRDIDPLFESYYGPLEGTVKTSKQRLGKTILVIKHRERINPLIKYGRSRSIDRIYVINKHGEKFLLPFRLLSGARAMTQHVEHGGNPYDNLGVTICRAIDEIETLRHDLKSKAISRKESVAIADRIKLLRSLIKSMTGVRGYAKFSPALEEACRRKRPAPDPDDPFLVPFSGMLNELEHPDPIAQYSPLTFADPLDEPHYLSDKKMRKMRNLSGKNSPLTTIDRDEATL